MDSVKEPKGTVVELKLPLPLDLTGELLRLFGDRWPNSSVITDQHPLHPKGSSTGNLLVLITDEDRYTTLSSNAEDSSLVEETYDPIPVPTEDDVEVFLTSLVDGSVGVSAGEWVAKLFVGCFRQTLEDSGAENFVSMGVFDPDGGRWEVVVRRPDGLSPMAKLAHLEAELADTRAALAWSLGQTDILPLPPEAIAAVVDSTLDGEHGSMDELVEQANAARARKETIQEEERNNV